MKAQDVMTTTVVSVGPGQGTREVARILRDKGISAVPVVDDDGRPLGMVSEGDLIGRDEGDREARPWTIIAFSFAGTLCGRLVDLNKSANSAIALCAS
jgi:CBS domain-containing protein